MALYQYQGFSRQGKKVSGSLDAPSVQGAKELLAKQEIFVSTIQLAESGSTEKTRFSFFSRSITTKDKIFFTKQLTVLLKAGIPLLQALELLVEQTEGTLKSVVIKLKDALKEGSSLADALKKYPKAFDTIYVQLVRAGEASGRLEVILERLTDSLERREALNKKVKAALSYPMIQLAIVALVVIILLTFVVPQIAGTFASQNKELPLPTRILLGMSDAIRNYYILWILGIIAIVAAFKAWRSTEKGARQFDALKLKIPLVRYFARTGAIVQFSRTLGMLIESGVNLAESLGIVVNIIDNKVLSHALEQARENIIKQGRISQYLAQTKIFPPIAIYLINTGEQSGNLDQMLLTVARYYEDELQETSDSLASKLEPLMLLIMAVIVGFIVIAMIMPMVQMNDIAGL